jgi:tRNA pseudouridine38-40 synthase
VDSDSKTRICHINEAGWENDGDLLVFTISADRFLRNMVRAIVGTLLDLGAGKMSLRDLKLVIEAKNRSDAGESVPAGGLFLEHIEYPGDIAC